jgi:ABC-type multidrug transport system permease subunit
MNENQSKPVLPFKSLAVALLFSVFLGPIGLLYASTVGGVVMIILGGIVVSSMLPVPIILVWLGSCIWSVVAVNRYNTAATMRPFPLRGKDGKGEYF